MAELAPKNTCVAPVYSIPELIDDPHFRARQVFARAEHPEHGSFRQVGPVLAGSERAESTHRLRSDQATDTSELLREVGMSGPEIEKLLGDGVIE